LSFLYTERSQPTMASENEAQQKPTKKYNYKEPFETCTPLDGKQNKKVEGKPKRKLNILSLNTERAIYPDTEDEVLKKVVTWAATESVEKNWKFPRVRTKQNENHLDLIAKGLKAQKSALMDIIALTEVTSCKAANYINKKMGSNHDVYLFINWSQYFGLGGKKWTEKEPEHHSYTALFVKHGIAIEMQMMQQAVVNFKIDPFVFSVVHLVTKKRAYSKVDAHAYNSMFDQQNGFGPPDVIFGDWNIRTKDVLYLVKMEKLAIKTEQDQADKPENPFVTYGPYGVVKVPGAKERKTHFIDQIVAKEATCQWIPELGSNDVVQQNNQDDQKQVDKTGKAMRVDDSDGIGVAEISSVAMIEAANGKGFGVDDKLVSDHPLVYFKVTFDFKPKDQQNIPSITTTNNEFDFRYLLLMVNMILLFCVVKGLSCAFGCIGGYLGKTVKDKYLDPPSRVKRAHEDNV